MTYIHFTLYSFGYHSTECQNSTHFISDDPLFGIVMKFDGRCYEKEEPDALITLMGQGFKTITPGPLTDDSLQMTGS